ncbi:MAG: iron-containing alcohol dehydrogenase, partial [Bacteroidales bacterium]
MNNFIFKNPTKLIFGKGQIAEISKEIPFDSKIMVTYGGGSIFNNGIYDQVMTALEGRHYIEFGGIESNPDYDTLMKAVRIANDNGVNFLLAVGGGS